MVCPILEFREEKQTFAKVGGGKVDFFSQKLTSLLPLLPS
jgi:hypothetical protein